MSKICPKCGEKHICLYKPRFTDGFFPKYLKGFEDKKICGNCIEGDVSDVNAIPIGEGINLKKLFGDL